jgi:hypothetical protein
MEGWPNHPFGLSGVVHQHPMAKSKSNVGTNTVMFGFSNTTATAIASAAIGLSSAIAAQLVWTPIDVVSQRLMMQGNILPHVNRAKYSNGIDAFGKILYADMVQEGCTGNLEFRY